MKNIVLIGFMGTGKTTVGRRLSASLGYDFADTDEYVKKCEKMPVFDIINKKGRQYFEGAEKFAVSVLSDKENCVISTGGTCLWNEENRKVLEKNGYLVWLSADAETIYNNTVNSHNKRQELTGLSFDKVKELVKNREKHYEKCDFKVSVDGKSVSEIAQEIENWYKGL